jgi:hypothetical protein
MSTNPQWLDDGSAAMCEICFSKLTAEECAVDEHGDKWDVCKGKCAEDAGIVEAHLIDAEHGGEA